MVGTKIAIFVIIQGSKNCGASSQADVIQNYFLWNRCANKVSTKKTLLCKIFSPCRCIVSSDFDSLSPLPPIPDARRPQFLLSCPSKNIRSARTFSSNCWSVCKNATLTPVKPDTSIKFWNKVSISRTFQEQFCSGSLFKWFTFPALPALLALLFVGLLSTFFRHYPINIKCNPIGVAEPFSGPFTSSGRFRAGTPRTPLCPEPFC